MDESQRWADPARASAVAGPLEAAEKAFREGLRLQPSDARLRVELAAMLRRLRRPGEAEALLREALTAAPAVASVHADLGGVLFEQRRFTEAAAAPGEALRPRAGPPQTPPRLAAA